MSDIDTAWQRSKSVQFLRNEKQETHPIRKMILQNAVGDTVLDVGCASSIDYVMWTRANYRYTGLDFTDKFMEYAKSLYPRIVQIKCDAGDMTVPDQSYDTVYCKDVLEHQPPGKWREVVDEMWRVTKHVMMIAFYVAPKDKPTRYELVKNLHYKNHYNKMEFMCHLSSLDPKEVIVVEKIGYNNSALYVVKK